MGWVLLQVGSKLRLEWLLGARELHFLEMAYPALDVRLWGVLKSVPEACLLNSVLLQKLSFGITPPFATHSYSKIMSVSSLYTAV